MILSLGMLACDTQQTTPTYSVTVTGAVDTTFSGTPTAAVVRRLPPSTEVVFIDMSLDSQSPEYSIGFHIEPRGGSVAPREYAFGGNRNNSVADDSVGRLGIRVSSNSFAGYFPVSASLRMVNYDGFTMEGSFAFRGRRSRESVTEVYVEGVFYSTVVQGGFAATLDTRNDGR